ncbi:MAG: hypothetical protein IPH99_04560 [Xanthomonadales bacterium]|nr:hypothetical protein [Xanthomonadales bacterium]
MPKRTAELLKEVLTKDFSSSQGIRVTSRGTIDQKYYATKIGLTYCGAHSGPILEEFQKKIGLPVTATEANLPAMREWLEEQYKKRALTLRNGKISRIALARRFPQLSGVKDNEKVKATLIKSPTSAIIIHNIA